LMSLPDAASTKDQEGQVESVDALNDADANVDNNVIGKTDENIHEDKVRLGTTALYRSFTFQHI